MSICLSPLCLNLASMLPAQTEFIIGLTDISRQGNQIDVQLLQIEFAPHLVLDCSAPDRQAAWRVNANHGRLLIDNGSMVVLQYRLDDVAGVFVGLKNNEYVRHCL